MEIDVLSAFTLEDSFFSPLDLITVFILLCLMISIYIDVVLLMGDVCNPSNSPGSSPGEGQSKNTEKHLTGFGPIIDMTSEEVKDSLDIKKQIPEDVQDEVRDHIKRNLEEVKNDE